MRDYTTTNRPSLNFNEIATSAWKDFNRSRLLLVLHSIAIKLVEAWLIVPIVAIGLSLVLKLSGHVAVSNWDAFDFLLTPVGMLYVAFLGAVTVTLVLIEQAGIMNLAHLGEVTRHPTFYQSVVTAFPKPRWVAELGLIFLAAIALAFIPFALLALFVHRLFLSQHDINYYVTEMPLNFWLAAGCGLVLFVTAAAIATVLCSIWSLALPIVLFEQQPPFAALFASRERVRGSEFRIALILVSWLILVLLAGLAAEVLFQWIANMILAQAGYRPIATILALLAGQTTLIAALTFVSNAGVSLMTRRLYLQANDPDTPDPTVEKPVALEHSLSPLSTLTALGIGLVIVLIPLSLWLNLSQLISDRPPVKVTAHRGHSIAAPENTRSAVRKAIESGADYAEIDVLLTSDGLPVLLHDSDLKRVAGDERRIASVHSDELVSLDVGGWFGTEFADERIPPLAEILQMSQGRIKLNIELKIYDPDPRFVPTIAQMIREHGFESKCVVTTFTYEALLEAKRLNPQIRTGLIVAHALGDVSRLDVDLLSVRANWLTDQVLREAHRHGKEVHVWTVNDATEMYRLIKRGVDNIITDDPDLLIQVRNDWEKLTGTERLVLASRLLLGLEP